MSAEWWGAVRDAVDALGVRKGLSAAGVGVSGSTVSMSSSGTVSSTFLRTWCAPLPCEPCLERLPDHSRLARRVTSPTRDDVAADDEESRAAFRRCRSVCSHRRKF